jgi:choline dehydrogenase
MGGIVSPQSRGSLTLADGDPHSEILIDLNALAEDADLLALEASVRQVREIGRAPALTEEWGAREIYPGPDVANDASLRDYVRRTAITYHHQVGTCKMGIDELAVVDPTLRVHGVEGLMVADASIMPRITTGNTNAPVIMIGEKAAEFLLA